jgi:DNA-binding protein HU-beta
MNQSDFVKAVAEDAGLSRAQADDAVRSVFRQISAAAKAGEEVRIQGFGSFKTKTRPARTYRDPRTGGDIDAPEKRQLKFKASKVVEDEMNS